MPDVHVALWVRLDAKPGKDIRQRRGQYDASQNDCATRSEILSRPDQPGLDSAKAEITSHDDRIEAFEKGECDL